MSSDLQNLFSLNKIRAHFKDETCITTVNQPNEQVFFKIENFHQNFTFHRKSANQIILEDHDKFNWVSHMRNFEIRSSPSEAHVKTNSLTYKRYNSFYQYSKQPFYSS